MERLTLAIVAELGGQDGLDILRLCRENEALATEWDLDRWRISGRMREEPCPELQVSMFGRVLD